jgi:hypothetical protein
MRIVIVSPQGGMDKFFEDFGNNRGVHMAVVPNENAAAQWLKQ